MILTLFNLRFGNQSLVFFEKTVNFLIAIKRK